MLGVFILDRRNRTLYSFHMKNNEKIVKVSFKIEESKLKEIDDLSKKLRIGSRSQLIRNFIDSSLEDLRLLDKIGLLSLTLKGINILETVKKSLFKENYKIKDKKIIIYINDEEK